MQYQLVFAGETKEGLNPDEVIQAFSRVFRVSDEQMTHLFSGKTHRINTDITQEQALKYVVKLDEIWAVSYVDIKDDELYLPPGVTEDRRKRDRRFKPDRRKVTRSNILPDRRKADRIKSS